MATNRCKNCNGVIDDDPTFPFCDETCSSEFDAGITADRKHDEAKFRG